MIFVAALKRSGGWPLVNRAYRSPPTTSEQVLHPEKYLAGEQPLALQIPLALPGQRLPRLRDGSPARSVDQGSLGEVGIRTLLRVSGVPYPDRTAAGWGADRYALVATGSGDALVWVTAWDSEAAALRFFRAMSLIQLVRGQAGKRVWRSPDGGRTACSPRGGSAWWDGGGWWCWSGVAATILPSARSPPIWPI